MDFRKTFDRIPDAFDRYRPRYCEELFDELRRVCGLGPGKSVLEIGPGTGQATEPVLLTGCDYTAIELGENFSAFMREKFGAYPNFKLINDDFETCDLGENRFDLVYSAATIQWIPEKIAFPKAYRLLKPGGYLAMFMTRSDERSANPKLHEDIDAVYERYFRVRQKYSCKMDYEHVVRYGFESFSYREWKKERTLTADEYIAYIGTHCEHITLEEPYRSSFYSGIREAVLANGNQIRIIDAIPLYLARKAE